MLIVFSHLLLHFIHIRCQDIHQITLLCEEDAPGACLLLINKTIVRFDILYWIASVSTVSGLYLNDWT